MRTLRATIPAALFLVLALATLSACDTTDSFILANETTADITVEVRVLDDHDKVAYSDQYFVAVGESIDTRETESLNDSKGGVLFSDRDTLLLCAYANETLVYTHGFTYAEARSMNFRFAISLDELAGDQDSRQCLDFGASHIPS